jgi:predicted hotdog family 3-hydroxylacyl-ACP dehydratase
MRVIDRLDKIAERAGEASVRIANDMLFVREDGSLDEVMYLELIAQGAAALNGFKKLGVNNGTIDGYLLGAKKLEIFGKAEIGDLLTVSIFKDASYGDFGIVQGKVLRGDEILARGEIKTWHSNSEKEP